LRILDFAERQNPTKIMSRPRKICITTAERKHGRKWKEQMSDVRFQEKLEGQLTGKAMIKNPGSN